MEEELGAQNCSCSKAAESRAHVEPEMRTMQGEAAFAFISSAVWFRPMNQPPSSEEAGEPATSERTAANKMPTTSTPEATTPISMSSTSCGDKNNGASTRVTARGGKNQ